MQCSLPEFYLLQSANLHAELICEKLLKAQGGDQDAVLHRKLEEFKKAGEDFAKVAGSVSIEPWDYKDEEVQIRLAGVYVVVSSVFGISAWHTLRSAVELLLTELKSDDIHARTGASASEYRELYSEASRVIGVHLAA